MQFGQLKRRDFMILLASIGAAWPFQNWAQDTSKPARIALLGPAQTSPPAITPYQAFLTRMRELGFRDGQNLRVEYRAIEDARGLSVVAEELLRSQPELIVVTGGEASLRAVAAIAGATPLVLIAVNFDPIARGYVTNLARPGSNITGVVFQQLELAQKQVEVLAEANPGKTRLAVLYDEAQAADQFGPAQRSARSLHLQVQGLKIESPAYDFDAAFRSAVAAGAQMALVLSGPGFISHRSRIAELAIQHRLPSMFIARHYVQAGGLMSYGVDFVSMWRRAADYAGKILNGANAADLPIEQPTKFEMVINLKTAKAIGIEVPTSILLRANEVIE